MLNREQILAAEDLTFQDVEVPEWGGEVRVRSLTGTERDAYEASVVQIRGSSKTMRLENARAKLVVMCLIDDETGERLFTDKDIDKLGGKNGKVLDRLFDVAAALSGLSDRTVEELTETFN